mgnify:CR=1 FL=1
MRVSGVAGLIVVICAFLPGVVLGVTLSELRAMQEVLDSARTDFARRAGRLSDAEASDYRAYIAQLSESMATACTAFSRTGGRLPDNIRCPRPAVSRVPLADIDQRSEATRSERTATLEAELDAGLGEFDERLLREQERVKAAAPPSATGSGSGAGGGGGPGGEQGAGDAETGSQVTGSQTSSGTQPTTTGGAAGPPGGQTVATGQPADVPDGSDDDVVARQMREAAENETDPELKEKLWEEYRRYKRGVQ